MPAGPRRPVERHKGRVYWPTRDVALSFVVFSTRRAGFLVHKRFGRPVFFPGFYLRTLFRVAGVLHFTYTHFSGGLGFAFYLHTLFGAILKQN